MKPFFWGVGLLIVLLAACLGAVRILSEKSAGTERWLRSASDAAAAGDMALAEERALRALACWDENTPAIDALTSHEETDEVSRSFAELLARAEAGQREEFLTCCARLLAMTRHLRQMERATWYNIL